MSNVTDYASPPLTSSQFETIRKLIYRLCGINLHPGKEPLVRSRLVKRLRALDLDSYDAYLDNLLDDASGTELSELVNSLTTNKTSFFREPEHFEYLRKEILPELRSGGKPIRIWSAGCSSGEEPYTLAMVLREELSDAEWARVRILGTDISTRVLAQARDARYPKHAVQSIPAALRHRYLDGPDRNSPRTFRVGERVTGPVRLARLNLLDSWPMKGPFDLILCRNVMIYFDRPTQERLVQRFWDLLAPGGHLFVGHSESLSALAHRFRYVRPAIYVR